jgi:hypothetical protein
MNQVSANCQDKFCFKIFVSLFFLPLFTYAQKTFVVDSSQPEFRTVLAGEEYKVSGFHEFLWGKHYRKEWTTPVKVPVIHLDQEYGGLKAVEQGGGRQTKTLRLVNSTGKQYVLRSIDKDYGAVLPDYVQHTFVADLAKDQVSMAHPFGSVIVPGMIEAAGVFHTNPRIVFVPYTPSLGQFNQDFANTLCLIEERPVGNQEFAPNFGFSEDVKGTANMYEKVFGDNDNRVDQRAFVRARLFDMFLGDWGRHDDQWRWAEFDSADYKIYKPIPRDRDQAFTLFDGFLIKKIVGNEELEHLQSFSYKIRNVKKYNYPARYIDRQLTNEVTRDEWIDIARQIQHAETDAVIENSVKQMPPEMFAISGEKMINKLKSRRDHLVEYAEKYYKFLTEQVEIVGTEKSELFDIRTLPGNQTQISLYDLNKQGMPKQTPFYSRTFKSSETDEIRLYGLKGNDIFRVQGTDKNGTHIRIIGGTEKDSMINESSSKVKYYDNKDNVIVGDVKDHLSNDTTINHYNYQGFIANSGYTIKNISYTNTRGFFLHAGYTYRKQKWRQEPFAWDQTLAFNYSLSNSSFGGDYRGIFNDVVGKWDLEINGRFDQKLKNYYYGIGNDTKQTELIEHYQLFTKEAFANAGLNRVFGRGHFVGFFGFYENIRVNKEQEKFVFVNLLPDDSTIYDSKDFAGGQINYSYYKLDDNAVPFKGFGFNAAAVFTQNLTQSDRSFTRYVANFGFYLPISHSFSFASRMGAATLNGEPEFYQLNWIGGGQSLRGYHRQRFSGKSSVYNDNEIRWLPAVRGHIFSGRLGLAAFLDNGRVWETDMPSNEWHFGYGGGLMVVPFNKIMIAVYYGTSKDDALIHVRLGRFF